MPKSRRIALEAALPDVASGVRAAIATILPFYLASARGVHELAWTAVGGWLGTLVDPGGSRTARFRIVGLFLVCGSLSLAVAERCAGDVWLQTGVLATAVFVGCILRALGASAASFGTMLAIIVAIGVAQRRPSPDVHALYFGLGAAWATVLSTVVWPVWTHLPVRRAIGGVYDEMASYANALESSADAGLPSSSDVWSTLARLHRRKIRDAIENARKIVTAVRARRSGESRLGGNLRILLGLAEAQFPLLVAMSEEVAASPTDHRAPLAEPLASLRARYGLVHASIVKTVIPSSRDLPELEAPRSLRPESAASTDAVVVRLLDASRMAVELATSIDQPHELDVFPLPAEAEPRRTRWRDVQTTFQRGLRTIRDALSPKSSYFRHAIRVTSATIVASFVGASLSPDHTTWVTITTLAVLQPFAGATWKRAAERVLGTLLGSALAAVLALTIHAPLVLAAVMFPLCVAAVATKARSYRLFTFFLTPIFVLIASRFPGDLWTAAARAGDALIGGGIALLAAIVVFPSWERKKLPDALIQMLTATASYGSVVCEALASPDEDARQRIVDARRACGVALSEAEGTLERVLAEPTRELEGREEALQLVTYTRRLGGALTTLSVYMHDARVQKAEPPALGTEVGEVRRYLAYAVSEAIAFVQRGRPTELHETAHEVPPRLPEKNASRWNVLLERVVAHAALVASLAHAERDEADDRGAIFS